MQRRAVWKFQLDPEQRTQTLTVPTGTTLLHAQVAATQSDPTQTVQVGLYVWGIVDLEKAALPDRDDRQIAFLMTGEALELDDDTRMDWLGTTVRNGIVCHAFELVTEHF
jgi:hypothetical protein